MAQVDYRQPYVRGTNDKFKTALEGTAFNNRKTSGVFNSGTAPPPPPPQPTSEGTTAWLGWFEFACHHRLEAVIHPSAHILAFGWSVAAWLMSC